MGASKKIDIRHLVQVHLIMEGPGTKGWVHTHGMHALGFPELEIRGVPTFMLFAAGALINQICDYIVNSGKRVALEQTMAIGRDIPFRFRRLDPIPGSEEHFAPEDGERWALVEIDDAETRPFCRGDHG